MKKYYLIISLMSVVILNTQAQFLMKSNSHLLRAGDEHNFNITNNADPGEKGPSIIWDFSDLKTKSSLTSYMYSAYTTENATDIPEANTVLEEFNVKFYFKASDERIEQYGTVSQNNTITKYDKPFVKMVFPFNYGDIYSGHFSGTVEGANNYKADFTGTYLLEADAYGTLILPENIQYKNVFRIKTTKEQCYTTNNSCNCATISYKWYSEDVRYPLLTIIQNQTSNGIKTIQTAYYSEAKNQSDDNPQNRKIVSENMEAKIYPNPFKDEFKIDYSIANDADVSIEIYDNTGIKVGSIQKPHQKAGYYTETIYSDILGNQLGMFHIRIIAGNEEISKTVIRGE